MRRLAVILMVCIGLGYGQAQGGFVGGGVTFFTDLTFAVPALAFQGGGVVADNVILRGTVETLFLLAYFLEGVMNSDRKLRHDQAGLS